MPGYGKPHPEVRDCGIAHGDRVWNRESGKRGTVVALSTQIPAVWVHWDGGKDKSRSKRLVHLDAIRLL